MSTVPKSDELVFKEYQFKCHNLKNDNTRMLLIRENLSILKEKNEKISKSLLNIKAECELYRSHLYKALFDQKVAADKQKILSRKKLDEFIQSKIRAKEYYNRSPTWFELQELIKTNTSLEEECKKKTALFELTKQQHNELLSLIMETFKKKVCEFCQVAIKHENVKQKITNAVF